MRIHERQRTLALEKHCLKCSGPFTTYLLNSSAISSLPLYIKLISNTFYVSPSAYSQLSEIDMITGMLWLPTSREQLADILHGISIMKTKQGKAHLRTIKAQYESDCEDYQPTARSKPRESVSLSCQKNKNFFLYQ